MSASKCFAIYSLLNSDEKVITDLSMFNFFTRSTIKEFLYASFKEITNRTKDGSIIDVEMKHGNFTFYIVGIKRNNKCVLIFTTEDKPHSHLLLLSEYLLVNGLSSDISSSFKQNKLVKIQSDLDDIRSII